MTLSESRLAYQDCYDAFDRAALAAKGIRIHFVDYAACAFFRMRMNQARKLVRRANLKTYDPGHPLHGASEYDGLVMRTKQDTEGAWWLYIEPNTTIPGEVEELE